MNDSYYTPDISMIVVGILICLIVAGIVSGVMLIVASAVIPESYKHIMSRSEDPDRHTRLRLYEFLCSVERWLKSYSYASRCDELGLLPTHLKDGLRRSQEQIEAAITCGDRAVRLWNLRQEGQEFRNEDHPTVGIELERLQEVLENLSFTTQADEIERVGKQINAELALLDLQRDIGALPMPELSGT